MHSDAGQNGSVRPAPVRPARALSVSLELRAQKHPAASASLAPHLLECWERRGLPPSRPAYESQSASRGSCPATHKSTPPPFRSGVRIPRDTLLRTELAIIAATPFRPQRELIYNCRRFAQGREPGSWS